MEKGNWIRGNELNKGIKGKETGEKRNEKEMIRGIEQEKKK